MYLLIPTIAFSALLLSLAWLLARDWWSLAHRGTHATGRAIEYRRRGPTDYGTSRPITSIFEFTTEDGRSVEAVSLTRLPRMPKPGQEVAICYDPADPAEKADLLKVLRYKLAAASVISVLGMVILVAGVLEALGR